MSKVIDCKSIAQNILCQVKKNVEQLKQFDCVPKLAVLLVGNREDSWLYVKMKRKRAKAVGITVVLKTLPVTATTGDLIPIIDEWNHDPAVHGIMVQLPLPNTIDEQQVVEHITPVKDVDGLNPLNLASIAIHGRQPNFICCTPKACMKILDSVCDDLQGKLVVVIGRSNIVGLPLSWLLQNRNATVISCDKFTQDTRTWAQQADILISATGVPYLIKADWVKPGAIVLDVGIAKIKHKIVGDVDTKPVLEKASYVTSVPGGVGPVTIAMLMENVVLSAQKMQFLKPLCNE